ncbi:MAG: hypothetical protein QW231_02330 [Candidatus Bathyarchaeia archaeon]
MAKRKRPEDYIGDLCSSPDPENRRLGENLRGQYSRWAQNLSLEELTSFLEAIQGNKERIGAPQLFGKFRAYSFEEFVYRLIQIRISIPQNLGVYWGEKCLIWDEENKKYGTEMDILIGRKLNEFIEAKAAVDTKIELDAARLKTTLASFLLLKERNPQVKCFLAYMRGEINPILLDLAKPWIDGAYQLSLERDETEHFIKSLQEAINRSQM